MTRRSTTQRDRDRATIRRAAPPCYLCGDPIDYTLPWPDPWCFTVDHIIPIDAGGVDHISNKAAAHWTHNRAKGKRTDGGPVIRRSASLTRPQLESIRAAIEQGARDGAEARRRTK